MDFHHGKRNTLLQYTLRQQSRRQDKELITKNVEYGPVVDKFARLAVSRTS